MAEAINFLSNTTFLSLIVGYIFVIWLGLVIWTYVDISRRTDNYFYRYAMVLLVAFGAFVGFAFYLMIRPSLTKREVESQRLEERFLLATSAYSACSNCGEVVGEGFAFCVNCGSKVRDKCKNCGEILNVVWAACPHCGTKKKALGEELVIKIAETDSGVVLAKKSTKIKLPNLGFNFSDMLNINKQRFLTKRPTNGDTRKEDENQNPIKRKRGRPRKTDKLVTK